MWYLFGQVWFLLLIAFVLGWVAHWLLCCRNKEIEVSSTQPSAVMPVTPVAEEPTAVIVKDEWKPSGFSSRPDKVDDLKRVKGIGAVIEKTLNELGIYQFAQISDWNQDNINWVENFISFPGRIQREDWVNQATTLDSGQTTEFAKRVDKGELNY